MGILSREPELSDILGTFAKTVDRLRTYASRQGDKAKSTKAEIEKMTTEVATIEANIAQATASADKIAEIIASPAA